MDPYRESPDQIVIAEIVAWLRECAKNTDPHVGRSDWTYNASCIRVGLAIADEIENRWGKTQITTKELAIGYEVSFIIGGGSEASGHVGRVVYIDPYKGITVHFRYGNREEARFLEIGTYTLKAIHFCDAGNESPLEYVGRIQDAIRDANIKRCLR